MITSYGGVRMGAHRVAWIRAHGPIPDGLWVLHRCDNRRCREITHLFLGTPQDNTDDMRSKRRENYGGHCKLTRTEVQEIRRLGADYTKADIARMFGVSRPQISRIVNMKQRIVY